ncbi:hypothetical protein E2562_033623 [Oryza meyeriana var. granulata]|uniref:Chalcone-flavonone isomerase family protein n=1 Tax=Oryza meyeriana var. granulata TaxID=110450 RepID=A0A6G1FF31_9ORYZ|nr:hypothetical protein E2562_033623 [Oryza meyeriana var. granulata]
MNVVPVVSSGLAGPTLARPAAGSVIRLRLPHAVRPSSASSGHANRYRATPRGARRLPIPSAAGGGTVGDAFVIEGTTNVKFPRETAVPGYAEPLVILGTGNQDPCEVDAEITSATVNYALYDGFFGSSPVSPTLRSSTAQLLEAILTK